MSLILQVPSRISNAVIFLIVDILGLWSIHRCLKGLQSYNFYRYARRGGTVHLARSRIPIFSGELLQGATRGGVIFVIANAASIVLAFIATLEVNGETLPILSRITRTHATSVVGGSVDFDESANIFSTLSSCDTRNATHFGYWPVAYSIDQNKSNEEDRFISTIDPVCQANVPGFEPLVMAACITVLEGKSCNIYDTRPGLEMNVTIVQSSFKNWSLLVSELKFVDSSAQAYNPESGSYDILSGKRGFAFMFREPLEKYAHRNTALVFLDNRSNNSWLFALGELQQVSNSTNAQFGLFRAAKLSPASLLPDRANFLDMFRNSQVFPRNEIPVRNIPGIIEFLFTFSFGNTKLERQAFSKESKDVTVISNTGIVLYGAIFVAIVVLFFMKELLICFAIRRNEVRNHEVRATEFDQMSRNLRRAMERQHDMAYSGEYTLLGVQEDARGSRSVGPVVSSN